MQFIFGGVAIAIAVFASGIAILFENEMAVMYLEPLTGVEGTTTDLGLYVESVEPLNVVGATITFPTSSVSVRVEKAEDSFVDVWLMEPRVDLERGEVTFAGGTSDRLGLNDKGKIAHLFVSTTTDDTAELTFSKIEVYGNDGQGTALSVGGRSYTIQTKPEVAVTGGGGAGAGVSGEVPALKSDLNGDGAITISDVSILFSSMLKKYDARYDLNSDGSVGLGDFSYLVSELDK